MQVFMRNVPWSAQDSDCTIALARLLHRPPFPPDPPLNFHVRLFRKGGRNGRCGLLTLPTQAVGNTFLSIYSRVTIHSSQVLFTPDRNAPDEALIARIAATEWIDPEILKEEQRRLETISTPVSLASLSFGRLCRDGSFSVELERSGSLHVQCDADNRQLRIKSPVSSVGPDADFFLSMMSPTTTLSIWLHSSQVVALSYPTFSGSGNHHILLEAAHPPALEIERTSILDDVLGFEYKPPPPQRVQSLDNRPFVHASRFMLLSFRNHEDMSIFQARARQINIHRQYPQDIPVVRRDLYSLSSLERVDHFLSPLRFPLAFEADKALAGAVLDPEELLGLSHAIEELQGDHPADADAIFRRFTSSIHIPSLATWEPNNISIENRNKKRRRRRRGKKKPQDASAPSNTLEDLLRDVTAEFLADLQVPRKRFAIPPSETVFDAYTLILTPTSRILEGPLPDQSNSVLRRFGHHDCFIRVSFQDENHSPLRRDPSGTSIQELLRTRYKSAMVDGIRLAGRHFEFLGYSMSGLREHSITFMQAFDSDDGSLVTADDIRGRLVSYFVNARLITRI